MLCLLTVHVFVNINRVSEAIFFFLRCDFLESKPLALLVLISASSRTSKYLIRCLLLVLMFPLLPITLLLMMLKFQWHDPL